MSTRADMMIGIACFFPRATTLFILNGDSDQMSTSKKIISGKKKTTRESDFWILGESGGHLSFLLLIPEVKERRRRERIIW